MLSARNCAYSNSADDVLGNVAVMCNYVVFHTPYRKNASIYSGSPVQNEKKMRKQKQRHPRLEIGLILGT